MSTKRKTTVPAEPSPKLKRRQAATGVAVVKKRTRDNNLEVDEDDSAGLSDATPKKASGRKKKVIKNSAESDGEDSAGLSDVTPKKNKRKKEVVFVKELSRTPVMQTKNTPAKVNFSHINNDATEEYNPTDPKTPVGLSSKKNRAQAIATPVTTLPSASTTPIASTPSTEKKSRSAVKSTTPASSSAPQFAFVPRSSSSVPPVTHLPKCHLPSTTSAVPSKAPYSDPTDELQDEGEILAIWNQILGALSATIWYVVPSVIVVLAFACLNLGLTVHIAVATVAIVYSVLVASALLPFFFIIVPFILFSRLLSDLATGVDYLLADHEKKHLNFYCRLAVLGVVSLVVYNTFVEKKACCAH